MAFKLDGLSLLLILLVIGAVIYICLGCKITCDASAKSSYSRVGMGIGADKSPLARCYQVSGPSSTCKLRYKLQHAGEEMYACCLGKCEGHSVPAGEEKHFKCPPGQIKLGRYYCDDKMCAVSCCEPAS